MHSDPDFPKLSQIRMPEINLPDLRVPEIKVPDIDWDSIQSIRQEKREQDMIDHGYAHILYEQLIKQIHDFEETLNPDEEIAAYLSSFGQTMFVQIENVGYNNPFFIVFHGSILDDGRRVQLVQHTTQLNVLFTSIKLSPEESRPAKRIGFCLEDQG
jgi:hypothetical protein